MDVPVTDDDGPYVYLVPSGSVPRAVDFMAMPRGEYRPLCFTSGTLIETPGGETRVEDLRVGGLVTLATGIEAEIGWIGRRRVRDGVDRPVRIGAGALGRGVPRRDLFVSPEHAVFLEGALIPAVLLVNGRSITRDDSGERTTYHHIELEGHGVLLAEGAPTESYLDTGDPRQVLLQLPGGDPTHDPVDAEHFDPCAELVRGGPRLEAIRERLRLALLV